MTDYSRSRSDDSGEWARARLIDRLKGRGIKSDPVLRAMAAVPRHRFVEEALQSRAYDDCALPISGGQTISQPYIVARMTELLEPKKHHRILEVGAGSGYQTAVLARLAGQVYAVERLLDLAELAALRLHQLGIRNVVVSPQDGSLGWPDHAPYHRILVAASSPRIPEPLINQLAVGGILVMPIGGKGSQRLVRLRRTEGKSELEDYGPCIFVKLVGEYGWASTSPAPWVEHDSKA